MAGEEFRGAADKISARRYGSLARWENSAAKETVSAQSDCLRPEAAIAFRPGDHHGIAFTGRTPRRVCDCHERFLV